MNAITQSHSNSVRDYNASQLALIRKTVAKDCNEIEFNLFVEIARRQGLDPFRKQIYAIVTSKNDDDKRQLVCVTGIDGYRAKAARCGDYRPDNKAPRITYAEASMNQENNPLGIVKAEVSAFKRDGDQWHEVVGEAYWDEFAPIIEGGSFEWVDTGEVWPDSGKPKKRKQLKGDSKPHLDPRKDNWRKMARVMIAKCAEAQALRRGWPEDLSGLYVAEEIDRAESIDLSASEAAEQHEASLRLAKINHAHSVPLVWSPTDGIKFEPVGQIADKVAAWLREVGSDDFARMKVKAFREQNIEGLKQFWAMAPTDALEVKKMLERAA